MERYSSYALAVAAALASATPACKKAETPADQTSTPERVVLLHFNDLHGALEQAQEIACVVERVRRECERKGCHVIVTNGGDLFGNTSVSEKFKGQAEVDFVNALGVDALVPGNHDTDYGQEVFEERIRQGKHWVATNLYEKDTGEKPLPSFVTVKAGSAKIAIAGFTFPQKWNRTGDLIFDDPLATARELRSTLEEKSDVQIALAHLENPGEMEIAEQVPEFDVVLGGHDHVAPSDYCHETKTATSVCETPPNGKYIVRLDMIVDGKNVTHTGQDLIPVDGCRETNSAVVDALKPYIATMEEAKQVIGFAKEDFLNNRDGKDGQNGANNFVAKVMLESAGAEFAMINATGVRSDIPKGPVTTEHIVRLVFNNKIVVVELTGAEIKNAMETFRNRNRYFALAGFTYQTPLDLQKSYKVATIDFLTNDKGPFHNAKIITEGKPLRETIGDYFKSHY
ncbi:bifunctional metallophosphatase/5'-nucleotidase [Candidatus Peregrinibacteria bacterium]|nr:bifunctional metallophosphatase/5'-nucleotidase [Candidatus Peregrinibacteria bacterium]